MKHLFCYFSFLLFANVVFATDYYVSNTGNDNNNGTTINTPWKTITKVNAGQYVGGDQILFKSGQTFTGTVVLTASNVSNNAVNNLIIKSYGTNNAIINAGNGNGIDVTNIAGISIYDLTIKGGWKSGTQTGNAGVGISFFMNKNGGVKLNNILIVSCDVIGFKDGGIVIGADPADVSESGFNNINVNTSLIHDNGDNGMLTFGAYQTSTTAAVYANTNIYIGHNKFYNNLGIKGKGENSGSGVVLGQAKNATIEYCVAYNNGWLNDNTGGGPVGIWCYDSKSVTIQFNEAYDNGTSPGTADGDGFDLDGGVVNSTMQYNYSHHNWGAGYLIYEFGNARGTNRNNTVRYNISQNDGYGTEGYTGIYLDDKCDNNRIYNNTVYSNVSSCALVGNFGTNVGVGNKFYNNIFYCNKSNTPIINVPNINCTFLNNEYYSGSFPFKISYNNTNYTSLNSFRSTGQEKLNGVNYGYNVNPLLQNPGNAGTVNAGDPSVINNYKLNASSQMINTGYDLTTLGWNVGIRDFNGFTIPTCSGFDIGACEYAYAARVAAPAISSAMVNKSTVAVFPNPSSDILHVAGVSIGETSYKIISLDGKTVLQNKFSQDIDINKLIPGNYFIEFIDKNAKKIQSLKFIKE